jgi:hypothetical protein
MNLTVFGANAVLNGTAIPATLWVQLHTGNPGVNGTANVAVEDRRRSFTRTTATVGQASNAALIEWLLTAADEDCTHFSCWSADAAGDCWFIGVPNDAPVELIAGRTTEFPLGELTFTIPTWS